MVGVPATFAILVRRANAVSARGVVRHPNYLGYLVWRSGVTLTAVRLRLPSFRFSLMPSPSPHLSTYHEPALTRLRTLQGSLPLTAGFIVFQLTLFHVGVLRGLHSWMAARYGAQWEEYKGRVPYGFLPGIV